MRIQQIVSILFALFLLICPFILVYFHEVWSVFSSIYVIIAVSFIWLSMSLLFIVDMKKVKARIMDLTMEYSVVIPCYNESYDTLTQCITSVMDSRGRKQVIIANDGSTSQETKDALITIKNTYGGFIDILNFEENRGKKFAQIDAIKQCKYDYCITLDSDTIVEQDTFLKLVNPLKNNKIGLTNVNVKIMNKDKNLMTKMQELHNYGAFMIGRKSLGGLGIMNCASGIGIGFRKSTFMDFAKEYLDKRPFGFDCKFGEDRYMTNIMLKNRYKVIMIEDAIAHTFVPETLVSFVKQQLRWKISGIIEGIHVLTFSWKTSITLFIYSLLNIMLPFMCQVVILTIILSSILAGEYINLLYFAIVIIMATLVRDTVIILEERRLIKYIVPYSILNLTVLLWLWWFALWRIDEKSWITR